MNCSLFININFSIFVSMNYVFFVSMNCDVFVNMNCFLFVNMNCSFFVNVNCEQSVSKVKTNFAVFDMAYFNFNILFFRSAVALWETKLNMYLK